MSYHSGRYLGLLIDKITEKTHDNWWFLLVVLFVILIILGIFVLALSYV